MLGMTHLQAADLIRRRGIEPDLEYMFKHALTQDVAYEGLLKSDRRKLHARTAQALEQVFAERLPEFVETLAFHYQRGGITEKAIPYLIAAGRKCVERFALAEASNHYRVAYSLLAEPELTVGQRWLMTDLIIAWSQVHYYDGIIKAWSALTEKHLSDAEGCDDLLLKAVYLGWAGNARCFHADFGGGMQHLEHSYKLAQEGNSSEVLSVIAGWRAFAMVESFQIDEAIQYCDQVPFSDGDRQQVPYRYAKAQAALGMALAVQGDLARSRTVLTNVIERGHANGKGRALAVPEQQMALMAALSLDFDAVVTHSENGMAASRDPLFEASTAWTAACGHLLNLNAPDAVELAQAWLPYLEDNENRWVGLQTQMTQASVNVATGNYSHGSRQYLEVLRKARAGGMQTTASIMGETLLIVMFVSIARMDIKPTIISLLGNPWFVFTQAPFAARKANALIVKVRNLCEAKGITGPLNLVDYSEGRLLIHQGKVAGATECLNRIRSRLRNAGIEQDPAPVEALAEEIARR